MNFEDVVKSIERAWRPKLVGIEAEKTIVCSGVYDAGDVMSESISAGTPFVFKDAARKIGGAGRIHDALVIAETTAIASIISLFLHTESPSCVVNDDVTNTAFTIADRKIAVVRIDFTACDDVGTGASESTATPSTYGKLPKLFVCQPKSRDLYGVVAIHNALDLADNTVLYFKLWIEQF